MSDILVTLLRVAKTKNQMIMQFSLLRFRVHRPGLFLSHYFCYNSIRYIIRLIVSKYLLPVINFDFKQIYFHFIEVHYIIALNLFQYIFVSLFTTFGKILDKFKKKSKTGFVSTIIIKNQFTLFNKQHNYLPASNYCEKITFDLLRY